MLLRSQLLVAWAGGLWPNSWMNRDDLCMAIVVGAEDQVEFVLGRGFMQNLDCAPFAIFRTPSESSC